MSRAQSSYHSVHWGTSSETRFLAIFLPLIVAVIIGWLMFHNTPMKFSNFIQLLVLGVTIAECWFLIKCYTKMEVSPDGVKCCNPFYSKFISWHSIHHVEPSSTGDPTVYKIFATDTKTYSFNNSCLYFDQLMDSFRSRNIPITPKHQPNIDEKILDSADESERNTFLAAFPGNKIPLLSTSSRGSLFWLSFFLLLLTIFTPLYFIRVMRSIYALDAIIIIGLDLIFALCGFLSFRTAFQAYIILQPYGINFPSFGSRTFFPWSDVPYARLFDNNPLGSHYPAIKLFSNLKQDYFVEIGALVPAYFAVLIELQSRKIPLLKETDMFQPKEDHSDETFAFVNQE